MELVAVFLTESVFRSFKKIILRADMAGYNIYSNVGAKKAPQGGGERLTDF